MLFFFFFLCSEIPELGGCVLVSGSLAGPEVKVATDDSSSSFDSSALPASSRSSVSLWFSLDRVLWLDGSLSDPDFLRSRDRDSFDFFFRFSAVPTGRGDVVSDFSCFTATGRFLTGTSESELYTSDTCNFGGCAGCELLDGALATSSESSEK